VVAKTVLDGARSLGLLEKEKTFSAALRDDPDSLLKSALVLHDETPPSVLRKVTGDLAVLLDPTTVLKEHQSSKGQLEEKDRLKSDTKAAAKGGSHKLRQAERKAERQSKKLGTTGDSGAALVAKIENVVEAALDPGPALALRMFHNALKENPLVKNKLEARKFELVKKLETAKESTGPSGATLGVHGANGVGSCEVSWEGLVARFVRYASAHNFDRDESTTLRIFKIFHAHLVKTRSNEDGSPKDHMSENEQAKYEDCQRKMVRYGVSDIALHAVATHAPNVEGNLADEAIELLMEMMNGGVDAVQAAVLKYVDEKDRENKFLLHLRSRLAQHVSIVKERKEQTLNEFVNLSSEQRALFKNARQTVFMLQQMCEGHNLQSQSLLRTQPMHATKVNLIELACHFFVAQVEVARHLAQMEDLEVDLVDGTLDFLIEACQGPCHANQELVVRMDGVVAALEKVVESGFHERVSIQDRIKLKTKACMLVATFIEGRDDLVTHTALANALQPAMFDIFRKDVQKTLETAREDHLPDVMAQLERDSMYALSRVKTIFNDLKVIPAFDEKLNEVKREHKELAGDLLDTQVADVEVLWNDRIELVSFPIPRDAPFLTDRTKEAFLRQADLSTNEKRMKQLIADAPGFMAEMQQIHELSKRSAVYTLINQNLGVVKWFQFFLVILLNLNMMMATFGRDRSEGFISIVHGWTYGLKEPAYETSLMIATVLACINLFGYLVVLVFFSVTEVPIIVRKLDEEVRFAEESLSMKKEDYRNLGAFTYWGATLFGNLMFNFMHSANYPNSGELQMVVLLGINLPWTLYCVRKWLVVPDTSNARVFCIVYDVMVGRPFFRNHVALMFLSILGFNQSRFFALMLLDALNISPVLGNVIKSVTTSAECLGWVFFLFVVTVIIYAAFGLFNFEDSFMTIPGDDDDYRSCHSTVSCFFLIFYQAVPQGMLTGTVLTTTDNSDSGFLRRVLFDLSFFIWVGVLLFNIITGLMVDGFGALREADDLRKDILENQCFVCGFTRTTYDDIPSFRGPNFEHHKREEHEYWNYVNFFVYLKRKPKSEYSGVESYVWRNILTGSLAWVPVRNSAALQNAAAFVPDDGDSEGVTRSDLEILAQEISYIKASLSAIEKMAQESRK